MTDTTLRARLTRFALLSIAAAVVTIGLKTVAWRLTGSVGFLSDAAESLINLVAAVLALVTILWATRPPDANHMYGHEKAEFFSAGAEGALILVASVSIAWLAVGHSSTRSCWRTSLLGSRCRSRPRR
jgi:cation diffusion facilitator family transporter